MADETLQRIYQLIIDAGGSKAGADVFKRAADQISEAAAKAAAAGKPLTDNIAATTKAYDRLSQRIDPALRSQTQFAAGLATIQKAYAGQVITLDQAQQRIQQLTLQVQRGVGPLGAGAGAYSKFGMAAQNASFQIADFAVQVGAGTSPVRAMAQQLPQLLGGFGLLGAAVGAVVAVGGALAPMFIEWMNSAKGAALSQDELNKTLKEMDTLQKEIEGNTQRTTASLQAEQNYRLSQVQATYDAQKKLVDAMSPTITTTPRFSTKPVTMDNPGYKQAHDQLIVLEADLEHAKEAAGQFMDSFAKGGQAAAGGLASTAKSLQQVLLDRMEAIRVAQQSKQEGEADKLVDQDLAAMGLTRAAANKELIDSLTKLAQTQVAATKANKDAEESQRKSTENAKAVASTIATLQKQYDDLNKSPLDQRVADLFAGKIPSDADLEKAKKLLGMIDQAKQDKAEDKAFRSEIDQDIADLTRGAEEQSRWWQQSLSSQKDTIEQLQTQLDLGAANDNQQQLALAHVKAVQEAHHQIGAVLDDNARKYIENADNIAKMNQDLQKQRAIAQELPNFFDQMADRIGDATTQLAVQGKGWTDLKNIAMGVLSEIEQELLKLSVINPLKNWISGNDSLPTGSSFLSLLGGGSSGSYNGQGRGWSSSQTGGGFLSGVGDFFSSLWPFKDGGIMTPRGPMALRRYGAGGVADSPQVAIFGEGKRKEAYVPLNDGRSIPVTLNGGGSAANSNSRGSGPVIYSPSFQISAPASADQRWLGTVANMMDQKVRAGFDDFRRSIDSGGRDAKIVGRRR